MWILYFTFGLPLLQILSNLFLFIFKSEWVKYVLPICLLTSFSIVFSSLIDLVFFFEPPAIPQECGGHGFFFALYLFGFVMPIGLVAIQVSLLSIRWAILKLAEMDWG